MDWRNVLDVEEVRKLFDYNTETGAFIWKKRPSDTFLSTGAAKSWNKQYAGKQVGAISHGYYFTHIRGRSYRVHRLIWIWMTGEWPPYFVDHVNRDRTDNRWANLRLASALQNQGNRGKAKHNSSGFKGVRHAKQPGRWTAEMTIGKRNLYLGTYDNPEAAHAAYCAAAAERFGEFFNPGGVVLLPPTANVKRVKPCYKNPYPHVYWHKKMRKWTAAFKRSGRTVNLGSFSSPEKAFAAYRKAMMGRLDKSTE